MNTLVRRPAPTFKPGEGLLLTDHFQVAYATNHIERACAIFTQRYGLKEYTRLEGEMPGGGYIRIALAWSGATMYEIVQAEGVAGAFYNGRLKSDFAIHHHHLGYLIPDQATWDALQGEIARGGWKVVFKQNMEGLMKAIYVEAPELGHYLEYLFPEPAGIAFFESVPSN